MYCCIYFTAQLPEDMFVLQIWNVSSLLHFHHDVKSLSKPERKPRYSNMFFKLPGYCVPQTPTFVLPVLWRAYDFCFSFHFLEKSNCPHLSFVYPMHLFIFLHLAYLSLVNHLLLCNSSCLTLTVLGNLSYTLHLMTHLLLTSMIS
jgi:hypothetical protein